VSRLVIACAGLVLTACATASGPYNDLAYQRVGPGAALVLHRPLTIPAGQAHADIQAAGSGEMDPYCILEVSTVAESPRTVEADRFEVWRVGRSISPSSDWGMGAPLRVARVGVGVGIGIGVGVGYGGWRAESLTPTQLFYKTRFWLRSTRQPEVRQLTCQWDQMTSSGAAFARHLTVSEIRAALGPAFTLTLSGESPPAP
jgi:hypothetical protein